jgi:dihydrofolate reductase
MSTFSSTTYRLPPNPETPGKRVHLIVAMDPTRIIGVGNQLPWRIPEDIAHFKVMTLGKAAIMGRRTWESIPAKHRPLPDRKNIILTRNLDWIPQGHDVTRDVSIIAVHSIEAALIAAGILEPWIIGGAGVYEASLPYITDLHISLVEREIPILIAQDLPYEVREIVRFPMCPVKSVAQWRMVASRPLASGVTYHHFVRRVADLS